MIVKYADTIDTESLPAASGLNAVDIFQVTQSSEPKQSALSLIRNWITSNATGLAVASGTITASAPVTLTQTWNNGAVTFTGFDVNVTDSASSAASKLFNFRVGGSSLLSLLKNGELQSSILSVAARTTSINYWESGITTSGVIAFSSGASSGDVRLLRAAAGQLAIRNSTTAQSLAIYNTYTDASNYERLRIYGTAASAFTIASEAAGTGTARDIAIYTGGTARVVISGTSNTVTLQNSSTLNLGGSGVLLVTNVKNSANDLSYFNLGSSTGVVTFAVGATNPRFCFTGTTSASPSIKRSGTDLQARLADDSLFTGIDSRSHSIYETYTVASNYERLRVSGTAGSAFTIASEAAGTGTVRSLDFKIGATTILSIDTFGATTSGNFTASSGGSFRWPAKSGIYSPSDGVIRIANNAGTDFNRLQFGLTTSAAPAIKRSGTILQARLADDSGYATYQGKLQTDANAVSEMIVPTHTLTLYDAAGTAYKVAVQAA